MSRPIIERPRGFLNFATIRRIGRASHIVPLIGGAPAGILIRSLQL